MATAKMSALMPALKGKIGGSVFQGGKSGQVVKNKPNWKPRAVVNRPEIPGSFDPTFE